MCLVQKKNEQPLIVDFDAVVVGESPDAKIQITNKTTGALSYKWNFDIGATDSISTEQSPNDLNINKSGAFTIKLTAVNGSQKQTISKTFTIPGYSAIITYSNLEFALEPGNTTNGRCFSFDTGTMFKDNEINISNGSKIHISFGSMDRIVYFFVSPDRHDLPGLLNIPSAKHTKVVNWQANPSISASSFDAMQDDRLLAPLTINENNESFGLPMPNMILFELIDHRKGVIKAKAVNASRLLADIKVQKY